MQPSPAQRHFDRPSEHEEHGGIDEEVPKTPVEKLEGQELPDVTMRQSSAAESQIALNGRLYINVIDVLKNENGKIDDQHDERG